MAEDKKTEEKRYIQLSRESVKHMADSVGVADLQEDIASLLCEDVNYRLREIVQSCGQFMRHAKRRKLTTRDFNKALRWYDVEPFYGHGSQESTQFHYFKELEIFALEDKDLNLIDLALATQPLDRPGPPFVKAQWLAVEGVQKTNSISQVNSGKKNELLSPSVSDDFMNYYDQMTKAILGNNEDLMKIALQDLKMNSKIAPALPFLINFVSIGVKKVSHDLTQLTKLLYTVASIINNQALYLGIKPYLILLTQGLLYCILEPLAASINPINDHWALRDYAARLLAQVVRVWESPVNKLREETLLALQEAFTDVSKPLCSHYGAIVAMIAFGQEALDKHLLPNIMKYWPHLLTVIEDASNYNAQIKADANKVYGVLLLAALLTMNEKQYRFLLDQHDKINSLDPESVNGQVHEDVATTDGPSEPNPHSSSINHDTSPYFIKSEYLPTPLKEEEKAASSNVLSVAEVYKILYECFGDSLSMRLPHVPTIGWYKPKEETLVNLFTSPAELSQTGEEMLEAFNVKEEECRSPSIDEDRSDDERDDNSLMSDDGVEDPEAESADVDLRIKSTVSDPTLGIKLTIAKLPRTVVPASNSHHSGRPSKRKKLSIKITKEQLEQPEPDKPFYPSLNLKLRVPLIEFCFAGAMPVPQDKLKRSGFVPSLDSIYVESNVHRLSKKMKKTSKKKSINKKLVWNKKFVSGNLFYFL